MYQDTYIEYWGEIFVSARIIEFGITFERFLKDPWKHLMSCGQESAPDAIAEGMLPLLPAQAEVARRIRESERRALMSGVIPTSRYVEHQHHALQRKAVLMLKHELKSAYFWLFAK